MMEAVDTLCAFFELHKCVQYIRDSFGLAVVGESCVVYNGVTMNTNEAGAHFSDSQPWQTQIRKKMSI